MEIYGDIETAVKALESGSVESYYLKGLSAIFRGERDKVLSCFRAAADPKDAFVQFGLVLGLVIDGNSPEATSKVMKDLQRADKGHPITGLARRLFP